MTRNYLFNTFRAHHFLLSFSGCLSVLEFVDSPKGGGGGGSISVYADHIWELNVVDLHGETNKASGVTVV